MITKLNLRERKRERERESRGGPDTATQHLPPQQHSRTALAHRALMFDRGVQALMGRQDALVVLDLRAWGIHRGCSMDDVIGGSRSARNGLTL